MRKFVNNIITTIYHKMQEHYLTFRILVWLKELGITRKVAGLMGRERAIYERSHPTKEMEEAKLFFSQNADRVNKVLGFLSDEKSRMALQAIMEYRISRKPIPNSLISENDQYFVDDLIFVSDGEVFIDGGAYIGDTIQQFIDKAKKQNKKIRQIIGFEPDEHNYNLLKKFYGKRKGIKLYKEGLSDNRGTYAFCNEGVGSKIVESGDNATSYVSVTKIDDISICKRATWIKMDIEGAEMAALIGARKTIKTNRPKLTICIYHSDMDLIRIAEYVHDLDEDYSIYIRHHSRREVETVLYCIPGTHEYES